MSISPKVKYGLLGRSLGHSFSMKYFTDKFRKEGIPASYQNFELKDIEELEEKVLSDPAIRGFNVTFPFKKAILPFLDFIDEATLTTGACNTVYRIEDHLFGYNTDVKGFLELYLSLDAQSKPGNVLILGTGGAAAAVSYVLDDLNKNHHFVSRSENYDWRYKDLTKTDIESYDVIVQTTPLGTKGHLEDQCPPIPYEGIHSGQLCIELNYNPAQTLFLEKCAQRGAATVNGEVMLIEQAEASWRIWNNCERTRTENENLI